MNPLPWLYMTVGAGLLAAGTKLFTDEFKAMAEEWHMPTPLELRNGMAPVVTGLGEGLLAHAAGIGGIVTAVVSAGLLIHGAYQLPVMKSQKALAHSSVAAQPLSPLRPDTLVMSAFNLLLDSPNRQN